VSRTRIKADAIAFTDDQLRELKKKEAATRVVSGTPNWMRHQILFRIGGNFWWEFKEILVVRGRSLVQTRRDANGNVLLTVNVSGKGSPYMIDNVWYGLSDSADISCPPNGKRVDIKAKDGARLSIEFFEVKSVANLYLRYPKMPTLDQTQIAKFTFPLTVSEVSYRDKTGVIQLTPHRTCTPCVEMSECLLFGNGNMSGIVYR
jgi:hypothetical protein